MDQDSNWERQALERIDSAGLVEQRRSRRWGIFFKTLGFLYFSLFLIGLFAIEGADYGASSTQPHIYNRQVNLLHTSLMVC